VPATHFSGLCREASGLSTLNEICQRTWLQGDNTELLRLGENAIYRLATDPAVAPTAREEVFPQLMMGAPDTIRTCAHGSGGRCSIP
jgi:hypothetical protein